MILSAEWGGENRLKLKNDQWISFFLNFFILFLAPSPLTVAGTHLSPQVCVLCFFSGPPKGRIKFPFVAHRFASRSNLWALKLSCSLQAGLIWKTAYYIPLFIRTLWSYFLTTEFRRTKYFRDGTNASNSYRSTKHSNQSEVWHCQRQVFWKTDSGKFRLSSSEKLFLIDVFLVSYTKWRKRDSASTFVSTNVSFPKLLRVYITNYPTNFNYETCPSIKVPAYYIASKLNF